MEQETKDTLVDIVIIGAGLTGLTLAFYLKRAGKKVLILEKEKRSGGVICTTHEDGFTYETGPNSGSMGSVEMAELFEDLGDACELEYANEDAKKRWVLKNGKWHALPGGLWGGITTPLFSFYDKFRILGEPFRKKGTNPHETIAEMVKRRLGKSYLDYAVDPFVSGIYAGDPYKLVTKYALAKLYNLEQNFGSFIGGSIKLAKQPKTERVKKATKKVFSALGGKQNIIDTLCAQIGMENIILNAQNIQISENSNASLHYEVEVNGNSYTAPMVVSTTGAKAIPALFPFCKKELTNEIAKLNYAKIVQVVIGYKHWEGIPLNAFGGLVPTREGRDILGLLFPSSLFSGRCPKNGALMTFFMGGTKRPDIIEKTDEELLSIVKGELNELLKCDKQPDLIRIKRYPNAIAQYEASSKERLEAIKQLEDAHPGLYLAGNIRDGIGMSDRVKQAKLLVERLVIR